LVRRDDLQAGQPPVHRSGSRLSFLRLLGLW
jgi:hypothetical protein